MFNIATMMTVTSTTQQLTSTDGATIASTTQGEGPPLVMVSPVSSSRTTDPQQTLPAALAEHFTVTTYDRRGNGQSTLPPGTTIDDYAVQQEIDDITALAERTGGPVDVYGFSSGAILALLAAQAGAPIRRLVLLEPPLHEPGALAAEGARMRELMVQDHRAARDYYLTDVVGVPAEVLEQLPTTDQHLADAPTMLHEMEFLPGRDAQHFAGVATPTLIMVSDSTVPQMIEWANALAETMTDCTVRELAGEWHGVPDETQVAAIRDFLEARAS